MVSKLFSAAPPPSRTRGLGRLMNTSVSGFTWSLGSSNLWNKSSTTVSSHQPTLQSLEGGRGEGSKRGRRPSKGIPVCLSEDRVNSEDLNS